MAFDVGTILAGTATATAALAQGTNLLNSLGNLLIASPKRTQGYQPQSDPTDEGLVSSLTPPPSILFHYEGEQTVTLTSDITDHFIEDNTALQDQIALKPVVITTHGFIGELNNVAPGALGTLKQAANTLTSISSYIPAITPTAQLIYDQAFAAYQLTKSIGNSAIAAVSSLIGAGGESVISGLDEEVDVVSGQNEQQTYFQLFYGYWTKRTLFTVQTPWAIFQNMAIQSFRAIQDAETRMITDFEVSFKMINVASTELVKDVKQTQGRLSAAAAPTQGKGTSALQPSTTQSSALQKMVGTS